MSDPARTSTRSNLSCTECRRRKAKCDRSSPCSNCMKYHRACNYEKLSRTPLTRKYVSDIEEELTRAKELLARRHPGSGGMSMKSPETLGAVSNPLVSNGYGNPSSIVHDNSGHGMQQQPGPGQRTSMLQDEVSPSAASIITAALSLETPPQTANFDWDERNKTTAEDRAPDGMAGLGGRHSRGYMGIASGAAFMRLADTEPEDATNLADDHDGPEDSAGFLTPPLTSLAHLEPYIDAYFQTYHVSYPIVHESTFRAQFMEIIPRPRSQSWGVLAHIMATIGAFASSETKPVADQAIFEATKSRLSVDMLETGNLMLVQALVLISNYVQKQNKPNSGYSYMGLAKRMAMGIGLHKEFPAWRSKPLMLEIRRRVWWALWNFDVGAIITFSRPLDLPREGVEVQLPLNVMDGDVTPSTTSTPSEANITTLYTHLRLQAKFHLTTSEIYSRMISLPYPTPVEMILLDDMVLTKFTNELPSYYAESAPQLPKFKFSHSVLHWRIHNFRILIYRAFVLRSLFSSTQMDVVRDQTYDPAAEDKAVQRCFQTATDTIKSITSFWYTNKHNVLTCWYSLYFLFQAVMIPVVALRNSPTSARSVEWKEQIQMAITAMESMSTINTTASRCKRALNHLCGRFLSPDSVSASSFNLESPQTQLQLMQSITWPMADTFDTIPLDMSWYEYGGGEGFSHLQNLS